MKITIETNKIKAIGFWIWVSGFVFGIAETIFFGSNWLPQSKAEAFCDTVSSLVCGAGTGLIMLGITLQTNARINWLKKKYGI